IIFSIFVFATDCNQSGQLKGLVPASGTVTFNGQPVAQATILFSPQVGENTARAASAITDTKGNFTMTTLNPNDGVFSGNYLVTVEKTEITGEYRQEPVLNNNRPKFIDTRQIKDLLPTKYNNINTTDLPISIPEKGNKKIVLELSGEVDSKPKHPSKRVKK
ncbi:MAG: carboxypeptidase-like regulatory domain-containing protein, partial [Planctomycetaceae bacterium]|nr:carboxypeptidase-like regulatory domain-containing protein [Planctomycetaceae bacterium]